LLRFIYDDIHVTQFDKYMFNFLLHCLFKNFSHFSSIDVTLSIVRRWRNVCVASEKFGTGMREWVCSRWLCDGCVLASCGC